MNLKHCEPYFRFWRIFVHESWGENTVTIDNGQFYGREGGPDLLLDAIGGFASSGFPSFNGWTATLDADGTAYVGAEWNYPIAPRRFNMATGANDSPKRFSLQCSNDKREWYKFGDDYNLPQNGGGGGGGGGTCDVSPSVGVVIANGIDMPLVNNDEGFISMSDECLECDFLVARFNLSGIEDFVTFMGFGVSDDVGFRANFYDGAFPAITESDAFTVPAEDFNQDYFWLLSVKDEGGDSWDQTYAIQVPSGNIEFFVANRVKPTVGEIVAHGIDVELTGGGVQDVVIPATPGLFVVRITNIVSHQFVDFSGSEFSKYFFMQVLGGTWPALAPNQFNGYSDPAFGFGISTDEFIIAFDNNGEGGNLHLDITLTP